MRETAQNLIEANFVSSGGDLQEKPAKRIRKRKTTSGAKKRKPKKITPVPITFIPERGVPQLSMEDDPLPPLISLPQVKTNKRNMERKPPFKPRFTPHSTPRNPKKACGESESPGGCFFPREPLAAQTPRQFTLAAWAYVIALTSSTLSLVILILGLFLGERHVKLWGYPSLFFFFLAIAGFVTTYKLWGRATCPSCNKKAGAKGGVFSFSGWFAVWQFFVKSTDVLMGNSGLLNILPIMDILVRGFVTCPHCLRGISLGK